MRRIVRWLVSLSLLGVAGLHCSPTGEEGDTLVVPAGDAQSASEDDWSLPAYVQPTPGAGWYPSIFAISWKELNPAEGVYDFRKLDQALAKANAEDIQFWIQPYLADTAFVPAWVAQKHGLTVHRFPFHPAYQTQLGPVSQGYFYSTWQPGYAAELDAFLARLVQHPLLQSPRFHFLYVPGAWRWGEWTVEFVPALIQQGYTPQTYLAAMRRVLDGFARHLPPHKLVWTGYDNLEYASDNPQWRDAIGRQLSAYALQLGMGVRHGGIERFNWSFSDLPNWGIRLAPRPGGGYTSEVDTTVAIQADRRRIYGAEAECFPCEGSDPSGRLGTYYQKKMTYLQALHLRMRQLDPYTGFATQYPALHQYVALSLGKTAATSADAWVALRRYHDDRYPHENRGQHRLELHNWSRWLRQVDLSPDGLSQPTATADDPNQPLAAPVQEARRTDVATGQRYLYFQLEEAFRAGYQGRWLLKVTALARNSGVWVDVATPQGWTPAGQMPLPAGQWHTPTLELPTGTWGQAGQAVQFRLRAIDPAQDVAVRFVRVVKADPF